MKDYVLNDVKPSSSSKDSFLTGLVFGFDVGTGSIGYAVRKGSEFKDVGVLICDSEGSDLSKRRDLRRQRRTLRSNPKPTGQGRTRRDQFGIPWTGGNPKPKRRGKLLRPIPTGFANFFKPATCLAALVSNKPPPMKFLPIPKQLKKSGFYSTQKFRWPTVSIPKIFVILSGQLLEY